MSDSHFRVDSDRLRPHTVRMLVRAARVEDPHWVARILALFLLLLCLGLGLVGLVLPIIPGLLFIAFAAMIASWMFPGLSQQVHKWPWLAQLLTPYFNSAKGFTKLSPQGKCRLLLWITAKVMVDSFVVMWEALAKLLSWMARDKPRF